MLENHSPAITFAQCYTRLVSPSHYTQARRGLLTHLTKGAHAEVGDQYENGPDQRYG